MGAPAGRDAVEVPFHSHINLGPIGQPDFRSTQRRAEDAIFALHLGEVEALDPRLRSGVLRRRDALAREHGVVALRHQLPGFRIAVGEEDFDIAGLVQVLETTGFGSGTVGKDLRFGKGFLLAVHRGCLLGVGNHHGCRQKRSDLKQTTTTAKAYRMYALAGGPPFRPGLVRDDKQGAAIAVEVWSVPSEQFGSFVAGIPAPLGIGKVQLYDGSWVSGFICEPYGLDGATEITQLGSWRAYLVSR